jgi:hypothetical protein
MSAPLKRRSAGLVAVVVAVMAAGGSVAQARAEHDHFDFTFPVQQVTALPECGGDALGTMTGTERVIGDVVDTGKTFSVHLEDVMTYRVDFPDGSYVTGVATERQTLSSRNGDNPFVSTTTIHEPRTIYNASGTPIGTVFLHFHGHITVFDANHNGVFEPGEIVTNQIALKYSCH